jgi:hypothetical protein
MQAFVLTGGLTLFCPVGAYVLMNHWQRRDAFERGGLFLTGGSAVVHVLEARKSSIGGDGVDQVAEIRHP